MGPDNSEEADMAASRDKAIAVIATGWGPLYGGINSFSFDFSLALGRLLRGRVRVICLTTAVDDLTRKQARSDHVEIYTLPKVGPGDERTVALNAHELLTHEGITSLELVFGHDVITGPAAIELRALMGGKVALFHHMSYIQYQGVKKDGRAALELDADQKAVLRKADYVLAVGPLLKESARRLCQREVPMVVPGMADIQPIAHRASNAFRAITFGRMGGDDDPIKQGSLAVAAYGRYVKRASATQTDRIHQFTMYGLAAEQYEVEEKALKELMRKEAGRQIPVNATVYSDKRQVLFEALADSEVALMLSWHEGFGLVGWEAIAAGVPLVVSKQTGLYKLLDAPGDIGGASNVSMVDILGSDGGIPDDADVTAVADALFRIAVNWEQFYQKATALREHLAKKYTWEGCARDALKACDFTFVEEGVKTSHQTGEQLSPAPPAESGKPQSASATVPAQQITIGEVSGNNNTLNIQQNHGADLERLERLIRSVAPLPTPDANAEIDVAAGRLKAGEPDIAIHMLEELRRKRWDTLSAREKYRTAANMGHALERKGEFKKSAKYYLEAKEHQPQDEKARAMEAIAYYHLDQKEKAYDLAGKILEDHRNCAIAIAVRIRSAPADTPLETLEALVSPVVEGEFDILHALVWRAVATGDTASANRIMGTALKHHPNADEAREQHAVVIVHDEGNAKIASRPVNRERVELAVETLTSAITKHRGQRHEGHLRHIRAEAYDILDKTEEAAADYQIACDADDGNLGIVRRFVLFLERHDKTDAAINALRKAEKINKSHSNRLMLSSLLSDRKQGNDIESAISLLQETIAEKPESGIYAEMAGLLPQLLVETNQHEKAIAFLDAIDPTALSPAALGAIRAYVLLRTGQKEKAIASAKHAAGSLVSDSPTTDRMRVAESLRVVGEKQESLKQWKLALQPDHVNHFVHVALELARQVGDDEYIMSFCKQLRAVGAKSPFTMDLEVTTLEQYRMFDQAIAIMIDHITVAPDDGLAKLFRVRLSQLGRRLGRKELVESDPTKLPPVESASVTVGAATAHALRFGPCPEKGIEYIYELVRRYFNDPIARKSYVALIGIGGDKYNFPELSVAGPGCAVRYREDGRNEEEWLIIEDAKNPQREQGEYAPEHIWSKEITGQSVGGKFHIRRDPIQPKTATITGIVNKYAYRHFEIMDGWEKRFPDEKDFFVRKYNCPPNPDGTPDISVILKTLDQNEKRKEEMHALYRANPISATVFAMIADAGLLDTLSHLASEGLPIRCCLGNEVERTQAEAALVDAEKFVLDPSALATLFFREKYEQLQLLAGKVVVCESALDEYLELRQRYTSPSRGFMGKFKGKYLFRDDDPAERKRQEERLDKFLGRIKPLVTLRTGESLAKIQPERREDLIRLFGRPTAEAMAEAAATGAVLWTDDLAVAEFGRERTGIAKRVWTQLVFKSLASQDDLKELTLFLLQWRYTRTQITPELVLAACQEASWEPDAFLLKLVAEWLSEPELHGPAAVLICGHSLGLVWKHGPGIDLKKKVAQSLLQAIRSRKDGRQAISYIQSNLNTFFDGDKAACGECDSLIRDMLQAERTPGEITKSKAVWSKAIQNIQHKTGMPGAKGSQSNGKTRNDRGPGPKQHGKPKKGDRKRKKR